MHIGVSVPARDLAQDRNGGCPRRFVADALDRLAPHRGVWVCASDVDHDGQTGAVLHLPQGFDGLLLHALVRISPRDRGEHAHGLTTRDRVARAISESVDTGARRCTLQSPPITPARASATPTTPASQRGTVAPAGGSMRRRTRPTSEPPLAATASGAARRSCSIVSRAVA